MSSLQFDSQEEEWFSWYADELQAAGFVYRWERDVPAIPLTAGLTHYYTNEKGKLKSQCLFRKSEYTPDFKLYWRIAAEEVFFQLLENKRKIITPFIGQRLWLHDTEDDAMLSVVEVKPSFDQNNMTRLFKNNQKFVWDKHGLFLNLVTPQELFEGTFTPRRFLLTKTGKPRKLSFKPKTLQQYLDEQK